VTMFHAPIMMVGAYRKMQQFKESSLRAEIKRLQRHKQVLSGSA